MTEVVHERCVGLDVHQHSVVACVRIAANGKVAQEVVIFDTTTQGLLALCDWLTEQGCTDACASPGGHRAAYFPDGGDDGQAKLARDGPTPA